MGLEFIQNNTADRSVMLESIKNKGFRKYKDFSIEGFGKINYILGNNNVGKTSILEAVYAWACGQNITPFLVIPLSRGRYSNVQYPYWMMEEVMTMVNDRTSLPFHLSFSGKWNGKEETFKHTIYPSELLSEYDTSYKRLVNNTIPRSNEVSQKDYPSILSVQSALYQMSSSVTIANWEIEHNKNIISENIAAPTTVISKVKPFQIAKYIDVLSHTGIVETVQIYSSLKREKLINDVAKELSKVFPEIAGFDMIPYPDGSQAPISIVKKDGSLLPLYAYGDGVQRWFYILGAIALYKNSIICIDEIDTGFHPDAQCEFNKHLYKYAYNNNVQLFITTHNIEYIDNFLKAVKEMGDKYGEDAKIITLREIEKKPRIRMMSATEAIQARVDFRMELR